jgi:anti-sigma factor RsiW
MTENGVSDALTCRELVEFLADYLSGELDGIQRATFEDHLAACPECAAYLKSYALTVELGKRAFGEPDREVPDDVPEDLVAAVLTARRRR